ncbi:MAG TPA: 3-methyl-2-oxobutanoate hydroxymethyltransferase [Halococcus sp.]|nr:3-methyl-2-oxobutanoate hydroxymethyltransferase [Halococcus sp.]
MPTTVREFRARADPLTMVTAYDAPTAAVCETAGIDAVLVGDSMGNASLGYDSTLPVTIEEVASRTGAVARATEETLVIADLPFLSFGVNETESIKNAGRMLKEEGAHAVKIESGSHTVELTERLSQLGIPVMAHLGLTPQKVNQLGYTRQGTTREAASEIAALADAHEEAGAFALVLEHVPANLAAQITDELSIPTIGIGAGPDCDGQVLVINDVLGLGERLPPFAEAFGDVRSEMKNAVSGYVEAVESGEFPAEQHSHVEADLDDLY